MLSSPQGNTDVTQRTSATVDKLIHSAEQRFALWRRAPSAFFVSSMLAGAYVGIGIVLIFVLGSAAPPEWRKLVMSATFGIALTLVVMAGADLFTGHHLYGALAWFAGLHRRCNAGPVGCLLDRQPGRLPCAGTAGHGRRRGGPA